MQSPSSTTTNKINRNLCGPEQSLNVIWLPTSQLGERFRKRHSEFLSCKLKSIKIMKWQESNNNIRSILFLLNTSYSSYSEPFSQLPASTPTKHSLRVLNSHARYLTVLLKERGLFSDKSKFCYLSLSSTTLLPSDITRGFIHQGHRSHQYRHEHTHSSSKECNGLNL